MATSNHCRGLEPVPSLLNHYRGHKGPILSLAFHPNTETIFSSSADGHIMAWNYKRETRALRFEGHCGAVNEISLSQYGDLMVSASNDYTARVWVPIINGQYVVIKGHCAAVTSTCFNPVDSTTFATASKDKTIKIWSVQSAKMKSGCTKFKSHHFLSSFTSHKNWVRSVRYSNDGRLLVSASDDKTVRVFDARTKECISTLPCDIGTPTKADFNPCGVNYVGVSTTEKTFLMFDMRQPKLLQSYTDLFSGSINSFAFHPSGDFAVCVSEDKKTKILDLIEGRPIFTLHGPTKALNTVAFNPTGTLFATGGKDNEVLIWEPILLPYVADCSDSAPESDKENISTSRTDSSASSNSNVRHNKTTSSKKPSGTTSNGLNLSPRSTTSQTSFSEN